MKVFCMQAALTAVEKRSKSALARTERLCEASVDSVRRGAAASLATEARRLEGLLSGPATRFAEEAALPSLGTGQCMASTLDEVRSAHLPWSTMAAKPDKAIALRRRNDELAVTKVPCWC